jgi:hypothetical protein
MTLAKAPDKTAPHKRQARGFVAAGACARTTLAEAAAGRGFAEPQVLTRWAEIVGNHLAGLCRPVKVTYARDRSLGATLIVHAEGARAPEVEHLAPRILERVNQFYGYRAIARIRLTQTAPAAGFAEPRAAYAPAAAPGPAEERAAAELARGIEDAALRAALIRMGTHVLARRRDPR